MNAKPLPDAGRVRPLRVDARDLVMGVHWSPRSGRADRDPPANLDALCLLLDARGELLEVVSPGHVENVNGSVMHTGDSPTGASVWDDERVFVFSGALPPEVDAVVFAVVSRDGRGFAQVPGATCHVSDQRTEDELYALELTALGALTHHCVAALVREPEGWTLTPGERFEPALARVLEGRGQVPARQPSANRSAT